MKKTLIIAVVIATVALLGIRVIVGRNIVSEASVAKASITVGNQPDYQQALDKALIDNDVILHIKRSTGEVKIHLDMESAAAYNNLGNAYMKDRQHDQAINPYKKALELDPKFSECFC